MWISLASPHEAVRDVRNWQRMGVLGRLWVVELCMHSVVTARVIDDHGVQWWSTRLTAGPVPDTVWTYQLLQDAGIPEPQARLVFQHRTIQWFHSGGRWDCGAVTPFWDETDPAMRSRVETEETD